MTLIESIYEIKSNVSALAEFTSSRDAVVYKKVQVKYKLKSGLAVLIFDDETETTNIFLADDPILKKIDALTE